MQDGWINGSTLLPSSDAPIEFLIRDRLQPLRGTFAFGVFQSRWGDYAPVRVASWRQLDGDGLLAFVDACNVAID